MMYRESVRRSEANMPTGTERRPGPEWSASMQDRMLQLQQTAGNQAAVQMVRSKKPRTRASARRPRRASKMDVKLKGPVRKPRRSKYKPGMHGGKKAEQRRLSKQYGIHVTGDTHESEHTIGFEPLNQTSSTQRGKHPDAVKLENTAWAYQEVKGMHRKHIGTGTRSKADDSGFNSTAYRDSQRKLVEGGDISSAVQINQLGYSFLGNKDELDSTDGLAATDSYDQMVGNMGEVSYAQGEQHVQVPVDASQRTEMYLARRAMMSGSFPTVEEENAAREKFGLPLLEDSDGPTDDIEMEEDTE